MPYKIKLSGQNKSLVLLSSLFLFFWVFLDIVFADSFSCNSCSLCSSQIAGASSGDTVQLTGDLTESSATCITFDHKDGVTFDCQSHSLTGPFSGETPPYFFGIKMISANNNFIRNCTVKNFYQDIDIETSSNNTLDNVTAINSFQSGIDINQSSNSNVISNSTTDNNGNSGVYIYYSNGNTVSHSDINSNATGIAVEYSSGNILDDVLVNGNNYGIRLAYAENNILRNSHIENGGSGGGLYFSPGFNSKYVRYNSIYNNYFKNTVNVNILDATNNQPNYFNSTLDCSSGNNIINGSCIGGNFWTTPAGNGYSNTCMDTNGNGICDAAYTLSSNNVDNYPLFLPNTLAPNSPTGLSVR